MFTLLLHINVKIWHTCRERSDQLKREVPNKCNKTFIDPVAISAYCGESSEPLFITQ